uniref:enoyl-[acyl-carrier-protein] reductase (NADH) n=1 Tax=Oryza barthii TaxID=65489 RepID=A0A0D3GZ07_9ORYZ
MGFSAHVHHSGPNEKPTDAAERPKKKPFLRLDSARSANSAESPTRTPPPLFLPPSVSSKTPTITTTPPRLLRLHSDQQPRRAPRSLVHSAFSRAGRWALLQLPMVAARPCISASQGMLTSRAAVSRIGRALSTTTGFATCPRICYSSPLGSSKRSGVAIRAMSSESGPQGLPIDLRGKRAFIAGVADDNGYGWAIAKALAAAGAEILVGTWVPALNIFETSLRRGKFDESRKLPDGSLMEIVKVYPLDAVYDSPEDVPEDVKGNKRYAGSSNWTVKEVAESVKNDFCSIDILVHSLANGPEVTKPLLETSRRGYLAALSASSYSFVSLLQHFLPIMNPGGASISLTYIASERAIPGYGGGMSSAKAALESDTKVLAFEAGRKGKIRVNTISAGPLGSRAAKAIGFIEKMIEYSYVNAPLQKELLADEVGNTAAFLVSPLASAITGSTVYVDNGLNTMGLAVDSPTISS